MQGTIEGINLDYELEHRYHPENFEPIDDDLELPEISEKLPELL